MTRNELLDQQFIPEAKAALADTKADLTSAKDKNQPATAYFKYTTQVNLYTPYDEDLNYAVQGAMLNAEEFVHFLDHDANTQDAVKVLTDYLRGLNKIRYAKIA